MSDDGRDGIEGRVFVGGLDQNCDEATLDKAFSMFGEITQITIMRDRDTNQSRGFGFISFDSQEAADDAMQRMHGVEVMGRCVTVRRAEKQNIHERGGFRGRRGGFRGGRGDFRNSYRGRGESYGGGRRYSSEGNSRSFNNSRGSYGSSRRGYVTSRLGYRNEDDVRSGGYDERRGSYSDNARRENYRDVHLSDEYDEPNRGHSDRYVSSRKAYSGEKYSDSYKGRSRGYDHDAGNAGDGYNSSRYDSRPRSRSPVDRYVYREESPVPAKYSRQYSPVERHATRPYSPVMPSGKSSMSKRYSRQESKELFRDYSPPVRGRPEMVREMSPEVYVSSRSRGRASSPPQGRMREPSPGDYSSSRSRGRPSSPKDRSGYGSTRPVGTKSSAPSRKSDYFSSSRPQEYSSRDGRSAKDYYKSAPSSRSSGGMDRAPGI